MKRKSLETRKRMARAQRKLREAQYGPPNIVAKARRKMREQRRRRECQQQEERQDGQG